MSIKVLFGPIRSCSVHIGLIWSTLILFCPFWSYSVHSVYFGIIWSYSVNFVHFVPLQSYSRSYSVHFVHFGPIRFILSTSVLFSPHCSTSVQIGLVQSIRFTSVHSFLFSPFGPIRSTLFLFIHILSIWSNSVHLVPIYSYSVHLVQFSPFKLLWFILIYFNLFLCTYIMGKDMLKHSIFTTLLLNHIFFLETC